MTESKFDYKKAQIDLLRILDAIPTDIEGWDRDSIRSSISAGECNIALDDLASMYLYSNNVVPHDVLENFRSLADQMDIASDPEWPDVAKILARDAKT